ncbi:MAG: ATP-dependent protease ATPase subunit HslU, partial [Christensenellaceae bacterium]
GMVRDLVECSYRLVMEERMKVVSIKATELAERKLLALLKDAKRADKGDTAEEVWSGNLLSGLRAGRYDDVVIEMEVSDNPMGMEIMAGSGASISLGSVFDGMFPKKKKKRRLTVKEAREIAIAEESDKLIDNDAVTSEAVRRAENEGIIFIDEIDKIAAKGNTGGADVSREGVQRDILPIVEGSTVMTKYGPVKTDFMLFIAAGAFHVSKVEDLIPELQGRFPIYVELKSLTKEDFVQILTLTDNSITMQYKALLSVDNIDLQFTQDAIERIAEIAVDMNETSEDIGARRLHTVMEDLLEEISFEAGGDYPLVTVEINRAYVDKHLSEAVVTRNLKEFVL